MMGTSATDAGVRAPRVRLRNIVSAAFEGLRAGGDTARLAEIRKRCWRATAGCTIRLHGFDIIVVDGPNLYSQYKDIFFRGIFDFEPRRTAPFVIDGGSHAGLSVLYSKWRHPDARVLAFEPDPAVFSILEQNVTRNRLTDVRVMRAALGPTSGLASFQQRGMLCGRISADGRVEVPVRRLSEFLDERVDFLKLNIEGQETDVLLEARDSGKLSHVDQMVVEYHGWAGERQRLGEMLTILDEAGYRYLVHDFDVETCSTSKPPFRLEKETTWLCLVYATRL